MILRRNGLPAVGVLSLVLAAAPAAAAPSPTPRATTPPPATRPAFPLARDRAPAGIALAPLPTRPRLPTSAGLRLTLRHWVGAKALKPRVGVVVLAPDGSTLYDHAGAESYAPASTTKLLTSAAALRELGPDHRFSTSVYDADAAKGTSAIHTIVLRGGGDPLLSSRKKLDRQVADKQITRHQAAGLATIDDLARRTAKALRGHGIKRVRVRYDDRLFGPGISSRWRREYLSSGEVSRVSALTVDEGRAAPVGDLRVTDPAGHAADLLAAGLRRNGLRVGHGSKRSKAPGGAAIASVASPPLDRIVEHVLLTSDNDGAEMLLRQSAIARGRPATFLGGVKATRSSLAGLGLDLRGLKLYDGSGLSRSDRVPPSLLARLVTIAMSPNHPGLSAMLSGLPVAGVSGTLVNRFHVVGTNGAGLVRAKTGTLDFVSGLAGIAQTADGAVLAFAFLANSLHADARPYEDRVTALLTSCGCRKRPAGGGG